MGPLPLVVVLTVAVDRVRPAVTGVAPLPRGMVCVTLVPKAVNGLTCVEPVACVCCVLQLLVTTPGLDDIAAIYCWAILACCLVVGSPLDGDHILGTGLSGTGVVETYIFKASLADG